MSSRPLPAPTANLALWAGIAFSFVFTSLVWYVGVEWLPERTLVENKPGFFYEWQLADPDLWTRLTAWGGYLLHQISIWALIWHAQQARPGYTAGLHRFNVLALAANAFFIALHLVQTRYFYDGLAQDVHVGTSQWSVIFLLVAILIMENQRRGIAFGWQSSLMTEAGQVIRQYHGYYFAWATIYTFWYHPMEPTSGHLIGFLYMFLLLVQGSLFFTRVHTNRYWTTFLELCVAIHGTLVAVLLGQEWPMFLLGFLGIFVITQMHGLGLSRASRWVIGLAYIALAVGLYSIWGFANLPKILGIPATEIGVAVLVSLAIVGILRRRRYRVAPGASANAASSR